MGIFNNIAWLHHEQFVKPDLLNARQFIENTKEHGGASFDVAQNRLYQYGEGKGIAIGGEPGFMGRPVKTKYIGAKEARKGKNPADSMTEEDIAYRMGSLRRKAAGKPNTLLGAWNPDADSIAEAKSEKKDIRGINIDRSRIYSKTAAKKVFKSRPNEKAGTDMSDFSTVSNPNFKPKKKK
jgi:hypothetical protein